MSKELIDETTSVVKGFHALPAEFKINECSKDVNRSCKLQRNLCNIGQQIQLITKMLLGDTPMKWANNEWITGQTVPDAFVVNVGYVVQVCD